MDSSITSMFQYCQLKVAAKRLPGRLRIDPFAVVFTGGAGIWNEVGRTERRINEWNPKFSHSITLPVDNNDQRRIQIRVDFYNKEMSEARFLGTCQVNLSTLLTAAGRDIELELETPHKTSSSPRVSLTALDGYVVESGSASFSFQLPQTNYFGVSMSIYFEISRASEHAWYSVFKSNTIRTDEQGWGQFPLAKITLRDLIMDEEATGLLFSIFRHRRFGSRKLLGHFQTSIKDLMRSSDGDFLPFSGNVREDLLKADVQILRSDKVGMDYFFSMKLVNVVWRAGLLATADVPNQQ